MKKVLFLFASILLLTINIDATTWFPAKHTCPVCNKKNTYQEIGSYGGYIYQWPSKYQYVYWPLTDSQSVYCCQDCYFSAYMWDFDSIPQEKKQAIKDYLKTIKPPKKVKDYYDLPMTFRLEIAEKIYRMLEKDNIFWCQFYRVIGYHYEEEQNTAKARDSRINAINLARQLLCDSLNNGQEKEFLYIIAAMHNFTGQTDSALVYLDKASAYTYKNKKWKEEKNKGLNEYLTGLIDDYKKIIRKEED